MPIVNILPIEEIKSKALDKLHKNYIAKFYSILPIEDQIATLSLKLKLKDKKSNDLTPLEVAELAKISPIDAKISQLQTEYMRVMDLVDKKTLLSEIKTIESDFKTFTDNL